MTAHHLHGMVPCPARPHTEPAYACWSPGPDPSCRECGGTFEPREWRPSLTAEAYGLTREAS